MNVDDIVQARIAAAARKAEQEKQRRAELAAARRAGLARRHRQKLANLAARGRALAPTFDNTSPSASGA
ncbi:hypothetical protein [Streptomyces sp. NPDC002276]